MRVNLECPRERLSLQVDLLLDGRSIYSGLHSPTGLWRDGPSVVYQRIDVDPGIHRISLRMRDRRETAPSNFDHEFSETIELRALQNLVIDFRPDTGGFFIR